MLLRISLITLLIVSVTFNDVTSSSSLSVVEAASSSLEKSSRTEMGIGNKDGPHSRVKRGFFYDFFQKMIVTKNLVVDVNIL